MISKNTQVLKRILLQYLLCIMERLLQLFIIRYHGNTFTKQVDNKLFL